MPEYRLICDRCHLVVGTADGVICWTAEGITERDHALVHAACLPEAATDKVEISLLTSSVSFFGFVTDRFGRHIADPLPLRAIVWALVPFVSRADSGAEMQSMRAISIGNTVGVKPADVAGINRRRLPGRDGTPSR